MNPPGPDVSPENAQRVAGIVEWLAKLAGSLLLVWGFIERIGKPYFDWRQKRHAAAIRSVLQEELACINDLKAREDSTDTKLDRALARQDQVFDEIDLFVAVVAESRERLEEMTELLDAAGYASRERRADGSDRRRLADEAMAELQGRLKSRRRREDDVGRVDQERTS